MKFEENRILSSTVFYYYESYFHDGSIFKITKTKKDFSIEMESTELYLCDNKYNIPLSSRNTLYGILHLKNVKLIENNDSNFVLDIEYDRGHIIDINITNNSLFISGYWVGYGEKALKEEVWFKIKANATKIYWENTADMQDPSLLGNYMGLPGKPSYGYPQWYIDKYGPQGD